MTRLDERQIISKFASKLKLGSLDDVAAVKLNSVSIVLKCDMLVGSTDVPKGMQPWQVARKSIVSCASDLAAKGVKPLAALISLGLPNSYPDKSIEELARGFHIAEKEFGVRIVGGDTNESRELVIDCSMIGIANKKIPPRNGAKRGDAIIVSGKFGYQPSGLKILMKNAKSNGKFKKRAIGSVLMPKPRQRLGVSLAKYFSSSIDSSDGLAISLYELARQGKVNCVVDKIPAAEGLEEFAKDNNLDANDLIFYGGEEYEIVATIPKSKLAKARRIINFHVIGRVEKGNGKVFVANKNGRQLIKNKGYIHFR